MYCVIVGGALGSFGGLGVRFFMRRGPCEARAADLAQMRVAEIGCVFEAEAERAVEAHMRGPDEAHRGKPVPAGHVAKPRHDDRPDRGMRRVVGVRADARIGEIAEHRKIGHQKQDREHLPRHIEADVRTPLPRSAAPNLPASRAGAPCALTAPCPTESWLAMSASRKTHYSMSFHSRLSLATCSALQIGRPFLVVARGRVRADSPSCKARCRGRRRNGCARHSCRPARALAIFTCSLPVTICFWSGPWPCTSALGDSTRRYSAGEREALAGVEGDRQRLLRRRRGAIRSARASRRRVTCVALGVAQLARLARQHDRNAVADRIGEAGLTC